MKVYTSIERDVFIKFYKICKDLGADWATVPTDVVKVALKFYPTSSWHSIVSNVFSHQTPRFSDLVPIYEDEVGWVYSETITGSDCYYNVNIRVWFDKEVYSILSEVSLYQRCDELKLLRRSTVLYRDVPFIFDQVIAEFPEENSSVLESYFNKVKNSLLKE